MQSNQKRDLWEHFERLEGDFAFCRLCEQLIKTSGTSLKNHMQRHHPVLLSNITDADTEESDEVEENLAVVSNQLYEEQTPPICEALPLKSKVEEDYPQEESIANDEFKVEDPLEPVGKKSRSFIWNHFEKLEDTNAACNHCGKVVKTSGNTSNLRDHVMRRHPALFSNENDGNQLHEVDIVASKSQYFKDRKMSFVWKHFNKMGINIASCRHCGKLVKTSGNTSNLRHHVERTHPTLFLNRTDEQEKSGLVAENQAIVSYKLSDDQEPTFCMALPLNTEADLKQEETLANDEIKEVIDSSLKSKKTKICNADRRWSSMWNHFDKMGKKSIASCRHCGKMIKIKMGNTSNLKHHMNNKHPSLLLNSANHTGIQKKRFVIVKKKEVADSTVKNKETTIRKQGKLPLGRKSRSFIWIHFEKLEEKNSAVCKHCGNVIKTSGNTTNLKHHMKRKHPNFYFNYDDSVQPEEVDSQKGVEKVKPRSVKKRKISYVWKHFNKMGDNMAYCRHCKKVLRTSGNTSNLISHITKKHPDAPLAVVSDDEEDFDNFGYSDCFNVEQHLFTEEKDERFNTLDVTCRGCKMKNPIVLSNIFKPEIYALYKECTGLDPLLHPNLPNAICSACIASCEAWKSFSRQCKITEDLLVEEFKAETLRKEEEFKAETSRKDVESQMEGILNEDLITDEISDNGSVFNVDDHSESESDSDDLWDDEPLNSINYNDNEKLHNCTLCPQKCLTHEKLQSHLLLHSLVENMKCRKCDIPFTLEEELAAHCEDNHPNEVNANFECTECGALFPKLKNARMHFANVHQRLRHKLCHYCGDSFYAKGKLMDHITTKHTANPPKNFKCSYCHKAFSTKTALGNHTIFHKRGRDFKCSVCFKGFKTKNNLNIHAITHDQAFQCSKCLWTSEDADEFKKHTDICMIELPGYESPPPYHLNTKRSKPTCPLCFEECSNISSFERHLQEKHLNDEGVDIQEVLESVKTKECDKCNKKYFDDFSLFQHITKTHATKTSKCPFCFQFFRNNCVLRVHILNSCKRNNSGKR